MIEQSRKIALALPVAGIYGFASGCGGESNDEQARKDVAEFEAEAKKLPYIWEFKEDEKNPGTLTGRATATSGAEVDFKLLLGPDQKLPKAKPSEAYEVGSIADEDESEGMYYVWKNFPDDYTKEQLKDFYRIQHGISKIFCIKYLGHDCEF